MKKNRSIVLACLAGALLSASVRADVTPATVFSDHGVLQQGRTVPIWGTADPEEMVTVQFAGQSQSVTAAADGRWMVLLANLAPSSSPAEMTISGKNSITIHDLLVGEVWIGSGQSNMQFPVAKSGPYGGLSDADEVIKAANFPQIRVFTGTLAMTYEPQTSVKGEWVVCSPDTVSKFSAVSYLFARNIHQAIKQPVGMLVLCQGASVAEAWISRDTLAADPKLSFMLDSLDQNVKYFRANPKPEGAAPLHPTPINKPRNPARGGNVPDPMRDQHFATILYNGMIAPVVPYAMRGVIWYQGESICFGTPGLNLYGHVQQALVQDWRKQWGQGDFPFFVVQLPGQANISNNPRIREEQATILALPHTGFAVAIDTGEQKNVHPVNKEPVGDRLARLALADAYGQKIETYGPVHQAMKVEGNSVRISFTHVADGLKIKGDTLKGFQIAGDDQKFVDAEARIDGKTVVVTAPGISAPSAVRYAFYDFPEGVGCNLYNSADLPAAPFRSDKWDYPIQGIVEN